MSKGSDPLAERLTDRDPRQLTDSEWRVLTDYRLGQIEQKVSSIFRTLQAIGVIVVAGIIGYWLTQHPGPGRQASHVIGRVLGL